MGWVTLTARKQSLRLAISDHQMRDIELSRKRRRMQRTSAYDIMVMQSNKSLELREIKNDYNEVRDARPEDRTSDEYNDWYMEYQEAKENYEAEKLDISETYDQEIAMLEQEKSDAEADIDQEQVTVEAQLEAMNAEFDVVKEQISKEIENSTIKL